MTITWKKDAYAGGRCFIFGTGASLAWMDHAKLRQIQLNEFTIGVNDLLGVDGEGIHAYELRDVLLHQADGVSPSHRAILNTRQSSEQAFLAYERGDRNLVNLNPDSYVTAIPKMRLEDLAI
jgi:hypothetical protein